jgi:flagellar hook-basal body complex protein FliE
MIKAIDPNQLLTQMKAAQVQATQTQVNPVSAQQPNQAGRVDFTDVMKNAVDKVNETQQAAGKITTAFEMGDPNVSLADVMIARQKSSIAFEATVQVRNRLIKAYEEVMKMTV